jgi:hypothetical protein
MMNYGKHPEKEERHKSASCVALGLVARGSAVLVDRAFLAFHLLNVHRGTLP